MTAVGRSGVAAGHLGHVVGGNHRGIGEGLVEGPDQLRQQFERARPHDLLVVVGAEVPRHRAGVLELGEVLLLETDAEGLDVDIAPLGDEEVAQLVNEDHQPEAEGDDQQVEHAAGAEVVNEHAEDGRGQDQVDAVPGQPGSAGSCGRFRRRGHVLIAFGCSL